MLEGKDVKFGACEPEDATCCELTAIVVEIATSVFAGIVAAVVGISVLI